MRLTPTKWQGFTTHPWNLAGIPRLRLTENRSESKPKTLRRFCHSKTLNSPRKRNSLFLFAVPSPGSIDMIRFNRTMIREMLFSLCLILVAFSPPAYAQSGSDYDWRSGNSYYWNTDSQGNTNVRGFNARTGSRWNTTIEPDGDMRGYDSNYNPWTYDSGSGFYQNFGTGETCIGKGYARVCN